MKIVYKFLKNLKESFKPILLVEVMVFIIISLYSSN